MSLNSISLLSLPVKATAALTAERLVTGAGTVATAAGRALGVARSDAAIGALCPVDVLGTVILTAGAAIANEALLEVGATGKAVTRAAGVVVARALEAAAADGDKFEALLIPN